MLSPTPKLISDLEQIYKDVENTIRTGQADKDNYKTEAEQKLNSAAQLFAQKVGGAIDEWLNSVTFIILPGLTTVGGPATQVTAEPYSNIKKI